MLFSKVRVHQIRPRGSSPPAMTYTLMDHAGWLKKYVLNLFDAAHVGKLRGHPLQVAELVSGNRTIDAYLSDGRYLIQATLSASSLDEFEK